MAGGGGSQWRFKATSSCPVLSAQINKCKYLQGGGCVHYKRRIVPLPNSEGGETLIWNFRWNGYQIQRGPSRHALIYGKGCLSSRALPARGVIARTEGPTAEKVPPTFQLGDALRDSVFHNSDRFRKARAWLLPFWQMIIFLWSRRHRSLSWSACQYFRNTFRTPI